MDPKMHPDFFQTFKVEVFNYCLITVSDLNRVPKSETFFYIRIANGLLMFLRIKIWKKGSNC